MKRLRYLPLLFAAGLVTVAALLPNLTLASLREALPWFSDLINRVEALWPGTDSTHVLMFLMVGAALVLALPHRGWLQRVGWAMAGVLLAALASEFVQFWVPGRTPLWSDVRDDLVGGAVGIALGVMMVVLLRAIRRAWPSRPGLGGG
jgi:VanZ family protein